MGTAAAAALESAEKKYSICCVVENQAVSCCVGCQNGSQRQQNQTEAAEGGEGGNVLSKCERLLKQRFLFSFPLLSPSLAFDEDPLFLFSPPVSHDFRLKNMKLPLGEHCAASDNFICPPHANY